VSNDTPSWRIRAAFSFTLSVVIVATVGVVLSGFDGIRLEPAVIAVSTVTSVGVLIAAVRRRNVELEHCANPIHGDLDVYPDSSGKSTLQSAVMVIALLALASAVVFAGATPNGESYSEFYLLSENDDGELVASDHPSTIPAGEGQPIHVAIENEEGETMAYDVVVMAHPNGSAANSERLDGFDVQLDDGEHAVVERTVAPSTAAEETRLTFLLFKGGSHAEPSLETADESLQIWVDVVDAE
jgi:uncharacterized membrane protein